MKDKNKNREGYKETKVGWIPDTWKCRRAGKFLDVRDGTHDSPKKKSHGVPLITSKNILNGRIDESNYYFISKQDATKIDKRSQVAKGDVLISMIGTVGESALIVHSPNYCIKNVGLFKGDDSLISSRFLLNYLLSSQSRSLVRKLINGGIQKFISLTGLRLLLIITPSLPEQKAIASVLECWDKAIQKYEEKIEKKKNIKKGLMRKLLSGEQRLPGFDGEWDPVPLGDTADPKKRWSFTGGPFGSNLKSSSYTKAGIRIIQLQNIGDGVFHNDSKIYTSSEKADELISCNIFPGDLILSKMGDPVARACIIPNIADRFLMCSDGIRLSVNENKFDPFFVYSIINARVFRNKAHRLGTGSTRRRIGLTALRILSLSCPPLPEQKAIASVLSSADSEIKVLEKKLALLRDQKKYLLNNLVTGTIRLPEFCKEVG